MSAARPVYLGTDGGATTSKVGAVWSDGSVVTTGLTGDVDLAVRVGSFPTVTEIPAPAGSPGNPGLVQNTAGER